MASTYDPALPTAKDRIRFALGDTEVGSSDTTLLDDETILASITLNGEVLATAKLAEGLASFWAQQPSSLSLGGDLSIAWAQRVTNWQDLAKRMYAADAANNTASGDVGGVLLTRRLRDLTDHSERRRPMDALWPRL